MLCSRVTALVARSRACCAFCGGRSSEGLWLAAALPSGVGRTAAVSETICRKRPAFKHGALLLVTFRKFGVRISHVGSGCDERGISVSEL